MTLRNDIPLDNTGISIPSNSNNSVSKIYLLQLTSTAYAIDRLRNCIHHISDELAQYMCINYAYYANICKSIDKNYSKITQSHYFWGFLRVEFYKIHEIPCCGGK